MFSQKYKTFITLFLSITVAAFVLFSPSLGGQFTLDDHSVIERGLIKSAQLDNVFKVWIFPWHPGGQWAGNYRPLTLLSFVFNLAFSDSPVGFRILNVLLYVLNAVLVFYLVRKLSGDKTAYLAVALFFFLPIHSEVVMSVVGRVYLLGTAFSLASLYYFLDKKYWLSSGLFLLAVFSGDLFISLILVIGAFLLLEYGSFGKAFKFGLIYAAGLPLYFLLRYLALGKYAFGGYGFINPIIGPLAFVSVKERIFTALTHLYLYLRKTVWPIDLSPDYSFNQVPIVSNLFFSWRSLSGLLFLALLVCLFYLSKRKDVKCGIILFMMPYLVMSNILFITTGTMAERWWYFPSLGLVALAAIGLDKITNKMKFQRKYVYGGLIVLLFWFSAIIIKQNKVWLNDNALFVYTASKSSNSVWARANLAEGYFLSGNIEKAKEELEAALKISDEYTLALYVLGQISWKENKHREAEEAFKKALEYDTHGRNKRSLYRSMALVNFDTGNNKKALGYMQEAVKWPPAGDLENILEVDEFLLKKMTDYADRDVRSYSQEEIRELGKLIKTLRRF